MNFRKLQVGYSSSNLADGIAVSGFPILAATLTDSPLQVSLLVFYGTLPGLIVTVPAGAIVDKWQAQRVMITTSLLRVAICIALLVSWQSFANQRLYIMQMAAFSLAALEIFFDLSGPKLLTRLVPQDDLPQANARLQLIETLGNRFIGAPIAGFLAAISPVAPFTAMVPCYLLAAMVLRSPGAQAPDLASEIATSSKLEFIVEGIRHIFGSSVLSTLALSSSLTNLSLAAANGIFAVYVMQHLAAPAWTFGLMFSSLALGGILGAFLAPQFMRRYQQATLLRAVLLLLPVLMLLLASTSSLWVVAAQQLTLGLILTIWGVVTSTYRQLIVPYEILARVNSVYRLLAMGTIPIGTLLGGLLAEHLGYPTFFVILAGLLALTWLRFPALRQEQLDNAQELSRKAG